MHAGKQRHYNKRMMWLPPQQLIERAASWFHLKKQAFRSLPEPEIDSYFPKFPSITIARDPGSGGKPIAEAVAERLGFQFYDEELTEEIAKSTKKRREIIQRIDEKSRTVIEDMVHSLINPDYVSDITYLQHLSQIILSIGHEGKAVILGRGANFILHDAHCLDVFITAPYPTRVERAVEHEDVSVDEAKSIIARVSAERQKFMSEYFRKDPSNANYYDLVINTEYYSIEAATDLVVQAFKKKFPQYK